jgi:predicted nucleotidyltransferase component of viral defense system
VISFGELRRKSVEWQIELSAVEKIYARDWLIHGIFGRNTLREALFLRGPSALGSVYFADYPRVQDLDFGQFALPAGETLEREIEAAAQDAARASGLQFKLHSFQPSEARIEFTGPLGRRSAAQPLIVARIAPLPPRAALTERPLLHPFGDECVVTVRALSLPELTAERIVSYSQKPRARDVYDLWFILTRGAAESDLAAARALAHKLATEKGLVLRPGLDPQYAPFLERAWERALAGLPHPPFSEARAEIEAHFSG